MNMQMIDDAGARRAPQIEPDVDALRVVRVVQRHLGVPHEPDQFGQLVSRRGGERRDVPVRHDHQVAVVVRI